VTTKTHASSSLVGVGIATSLVLALGACSKTRDEPAPTPATVVMPGNAPPDAISIVASGAASPVAMPAATADPTTTPAAAPSITPTSLTGGTVTVFTGTAPASSATATSPTVVTLPSAGMPMPSASLPAAGAIGPASASSSDQPLSVSPGTTR